MDTISRHVRSITKAGVAVAALMGSASALAESSAFIMTLYSNGAGARTMMSGDYAAAAADISSSKSLEMHPSTKTTNLCVAQVMSSQLAAARSSCNAAVDQALTERAVSPTWMPRTASYRHAVAIAYSNRAVMHWLARDVENATADLASARRFAPKADFVTQNLGALVAADPQTRMRLSGMP